MKIYISVDMEGITGVSSQKQCIPGQEDYLRFRRIMTAEINAAITGAKKAGAEKFLVNDAHGTMTNILIENLDASARLISGSNKHLCQMEGIDESFNGVFFIGYHAGAGFGDGTLNHTVLSNTVSEIKCNGEVMDEAGINAGIAGYYSVPVLLVSGDDVVCQAAKNRFRGVKVAQVKEAIDRVTVNSNSFSKSKELVAEQAYCAVKEYKQIQPYKVASPTTFIVTFKSTSSANMCTLFPQVKREGTKTIKLTADNYLDAYKQLWGLLILARATQDGVI